MNKLTYFTLGGLITTTLLLSGCDRPRDEPITRAPDVKMSYGEPTEAQQELTYGGPTETRSQEQYVEQMEEAAADESFIYDGESGEAIADRVQEWNQNAP